MIHLCFFDTPFGTCLVNARPHIQPTVLVGATIRISRINDHSPSMTLTRSWKSLDTWAPEPTCLHPGLTRFISFKTGMALRCGDQQYWILHSSRRLRKIRTVTSTNCDDGCRIIEVMLAWNECRVLPYLASGHSDRSGTRKLWRSRSEAPFCKSPNLNRKVRLMAFDCFSRVDEGPCSTGDSRKWRQGFGMRWVSRAGWRTLVGTVIPKEKMYIPEVGEIVRVMKKLMSIQVGRSWHFRLIWLSCRLNPPKIHAYSRAP
jgi:hypothetical protein